MGPEVNRDLLKKLMLSLVAAIDPNNWMLVRILVKKALAIKFDQISQMHEVIFEDTL